MLALLILLPSFAGAQTHRATVRGTVFDPSQARVAGAQITITNNSTSETRNSTADADGEYTISSLPAGSYRIQVSSTNFVPYTYDSFVLTVNQVLRLDVTLTVAGPNVDENMIVASFGTELKKDSASLGTVIENRQISGLPLDGRNFYELNLLVPGAAPAAGGSSFLPSPRGFVVRICLRSPA